MTTCTGLGIPAPHELSMEESRRKIDEIMEFDRKLSEPFSESELAELFKKVGTLAPLGFVEGMQAAEQLSAEYTQKDVDNLIEQLQCSVLSKLRLNLPFSEAELTELFRKRSWGSRRGWRDYQLLTPEEKYFVDKSGWTPEEKIYKEPEFAAWNESKPLSREEQRLEMKKAVQSTQIGDKLIFGNSGKGKILTLKHAAKDKTFYFIHLSDTATFRFSRQQLDKIKRQMPFIADDRTAALWAEVLGDMTVESCKLTAEQLKYLEAKVQETLDVLENYKIDIYDDKYFDCPRDYYDNYELLTETEKESLERLGLTPPLRKKEASGDENVFGKNILEAANDSASARRHLKRNIVKRPEFFNLSCEDDFDVAFDNGCYYINKKNAYTIGIPWFRHDLIVKKSDLRSDQIEFLERKCEETKRKVAEFKKRIDTEKTFGSGFCVD